LKEFDAFKCPGCGSYNTGAIDENYRRCNLCGTAWDREYSDEKGVHIHKDTAIFEILLAEDTLS